MRPGGYWLWQVCNKSSCTFMTVLLTQVQNVSSTAEPDRYHDDQWVGRAVTKCVPCFRQQAQRIRSLGDWGARASLAPGNVNASPELRAAANKSIIRPHIMPFWQQLCIQLNAHVKQASHIHCPFSFSQGVLTVALMVARDGHERQEAGEQGDLLVVVVPVRQETAAWHGGGLPVRHSKVFVPTKVLNYKLSCFSSPGKIGIWVCSFNGPGEDNLNGIVQANVLCE